MNWSMRKVKTRKTSDFPGKSGSLVCNEYITPGIIKFAFWQMTNEWPEATYACLNYSKAFAPDEIKAKSICMNGDIGDIMNRIMNARGDGGNRLLN